MIFLFLFYLIFFVGAVKDEKPEHSSLLHVSALCDGSFSISIHGEQWLSSKSVFIRAESRLFSTDDKTLLVETCREGLYGRDFIHGNYTATEIVWKTQKGAPSFITVIKTYIEKDMVSFHQMWPFGASNTSTNHRVCNYDELAWIGCDWPEVSSSFPSFVVGEGEETKNLKGWFEFYGEHLNDAHNPNHRGPRTGVWKKGTAIPGGLLAGPFALFDKFGNAIVISSLTQHMSASVQFQTEDEVLRYGVMGGVESISPNFEISFILVAGDSGINRVFEKWGNVLLAAGGKNGQGFKLDPTCNYLGYQTDNGAYYYYSPSIGGNYLDTLTAVMLGDQNGAKDTINKTLPYQYIELDSWRYFKGTGTTGGGGVPLGGGLKNWTTDPSTFPGGDAGVYELKKRTGVLGFLTHNRWFQNITDYAKENGGKWDFILEQDSAAYPGNALALPTQTEFWTELLSEAKKNAGLLVYEQDWLWVQFLGMEATTRRTSLADEWLRQMDEGAKNAGLVIQYCMALPRHVLASANLLSVTQVRVSDDYGAGVRDQQWRIGRSSLLATSLGLASYKDGWMSREVEIGGKFSGAEPYPDLQSAVSAFSSGPVTPNDGLNQNNPELIMKTCTKDGKLLHPSRSATTIDKSYIDEIILSANETFWPNRSEIWATFTRIENNEAPYFHLLAADLQKERTTVTLKEADTSYNELSRKSEYWVIFRSWPSLEISVKTWFQAEFILKKRQLPDFEIWHAAPVFKDKGNGWCLLGEKQKWVPVSTTRIESLSYTNYGIEIGVRGDIGESVLIQFLQVDFIAMKPIQLVDVTCDFKNSRNGRGKIRIPEKICFIS